MNRYEPSIPRVAFGVAAIVMTAITMGMGLVLPAWVEPGDQGAGRLATSEAAPPPAAVAINPARINVVGVRERELVSAQAREVDPKCKQDKQDI